MNEEKINEGDLQPANQSQKKKPVSIIKVFAIIAAIGGLIQCTGGIGEGDNSMALVAVVGFIIVWVTMFDAMDKANADYYRDFSEKITKTMLAKHFDHPESADNTDVPYKEEFDILFPVRNKIDVFCHFKGGYKGKAFAYYELEAIIASSDASDTCFRGSWFILDLEGEKEEMGILRNIAKLYRFDFRTKKKLYRVKTGINLYDNYLKIYSYSEQESSALLNKQSFLDQIVDISKESWVPITILLYKGKLHILFDQKNSLAETYQCKKLNAEDLSKIERNFIYLAKLLAGFNQP